MQNDSNSNNTIQLKDIQKQYPGMSNRWILTHLNLSIKKGEFFCIIGPSGCGKSTILKIIAGLEQVNEGKVERPDRVSMVFQSGALFPWFNVKDNITFGLRVKNVEKKEIEKSVIKYLQMMRLEGLENKYPRELSGGQRQRVGIARALAVNPQVLLLDEPFSSLDPLTTDELHTDLLSIWKQTGITIVMVSHLIEEAVYLADRIGIMKQGTIKEIRWIDFQRPRDLQSKELKKIILEIKKDFV